MPIVKATGVTDKSKSQKSLYSFFCKVDDKKKEENVNSAKEEEKEKEKASQSDVILKKSDTINSTSNTNIKSTPTVKAKEVTPDSNSSKCSEKVPRNLEQKKTNLRLEDNDDLKDSDEEENVVINRKRKLNKTGTVSSSDKKKKTKTSLLDSDEEWSASEKADSDDGEEYNASEVDDDEMSISEDSFVVDDDDEDDYPKKQKPSKKTAAKEIKATPASSARKNTSLPPKAKAGLKSSDNAGPKYCLIMDSTPSKGINSAFPNIVTPSGLQTPNGAESYPATPASATNVKLFQLPEGVVGQGSHEHNSYDFLKPENRRDADGHPVNHPDYNPRTLKVPQKYLSEQTPAMQQWWQFKAQNMDTVLFFKVGKFYELFHFDADIGFSELDLIYMKGHKAHSGFPEVSYGKFASILVAKGYRVARIEQTETPDMLKERNESAGKGKKEKVVARELCAIMTKGTRTYCHLDDLSLLDETGGDAVSTSLLMCIKEQPIVAASSAGTGDVEDIDDDAVIEYGITAVDTVIGKITLAQFQDNRQRTRLRAFLARYLATEVLLPFQAASEETIGAIKLICPKATIEFLRGNELPSDAQEVLISLFKAQYFPLSLEKKIPFVHENLEQLTQAAKNSWPSVLYAVTQGIADGSSTLMILSLGGALWQLRRSLIDYEVFSMGKFYGYIPADEQIDPSVQKIPVGSEPMDVVPAVNHHLQINSESSTRSKQENFEVPSTQKRMVLDEVSLTNLEVLVNNYDRTESGSLWHFVNRCKTVGGKRLLHSWLCHPLFHIDDITRRSKAVEELLSSSLVSTIEEVKKRLKGIPDLERLLVRVHSNGIKRKGAADHPDARAIMFESSIYTIRKIRDFADILAGFETVIHIIESFQIIPLQSPLLQFALHGGTKSHPTDDTSNQQNNYFPLTEIKQSLQYFRTIFDEKQAKKDGNIKPRPGINSDYDEAMEEINEITQSFENYLKEMKKLTGISDLKYFGNGKDRYQLEVPINLSKNVPTTWTSKSQKKTHRRYWTKTIEDKLQQLMHAEENATDAQKDTLRNIFEKFDMTRHYWERAAASISFLDALLSLATISSLPGYVVPQFLKKDITVGPILQIVGGRHPMLEYTLAQKNGNSYIPNDVELGGKRNQQQNDEYIARLLLLTGPNMGGKSTLLRQTCLIVILAQLGCRVPADSCVLTPVDRIFTRVGASDRILAGQSTFFVELAETSLILKAATEDSLCILDELGRGTATFDGTAIAHSVVDYLVSKIRCRTLFATHYHLLIEDWEIDPRVQLGHMDCFVETSSPSSTPSSIAKERRENKEDAQQVVFLYKLSPGSSPKSYGINVAKLAGMPQAVINLAFQQSQQFEEKSKLHLETNGFISKISSIFERLVSITNYANLTVEELVYLTSELWKRYNSMKHELD